MIELEYYHFACPLPARLEGLNESQQGGGNPFIQVPNGPPCPLDLPPPLSLGSGLPKLF